MRIQQLITHSKLSKISYTSLPTCTKDTLREYSNTSYFALTVDGKVSITVRCFEKNDRPLLPCFWFQARPRLVPRLLKRRQNLPNYLLFCINIIQAVIILFHCSSSLVRTCPPNYVVLIALRICSFNICR